MMDYDEICEINIDSSMDIDGIEFKVLSNTYNIYLLAFLQS